MVSSGPLTILNSTISANSATGGGGGGFVIAGTADMTNSTISGNSASEFNFGIGFGGGIHISAGTLTVTNSTITSNSAQFRGGGIINSSGTLRSRNTIIALNTAGTGGGPDVFGPLFSEGFNLIGDNSDATITPAQFSDQIGMAGSPIDPLLGPLQNNGGPTFTQTLLVSSRAINKANAAIAPERDQRGYVRSDTPDVGAFEFGATIPVTLANISTRVTVETGDMVLIGGFIVTGTEPKKVIVRAIGPSLPVAGKLANPTLELYDASGLLVSNDNWKSTQQAEIEATTIPPPNDLESAIVATLPANNSAYTAIVRGANNTTGVGLVEVYDLDRTVDSKLANISTRGLVQTGDDVIIGGLIVLGADPQNVIVRAIGPSLPVAGRLADPMLELQTPTARSWSRMTTGEATRRRRSSRPR